MKILVILLIIIFNNSFAIEGKFLGSKTIEEMPSWFKNSFLDLNDDVDEANENNKHLVLYFHQQGCPYCEKLINDNFKNPALVAQIRKNFEIIELNIWGDRAVVDFSNNEISEKDFSANMQIQFTPTLLFIDKNAKNILRLDGYQPTERMAKVFDFIQNKLYLTTSFASFSSIEDSGNKLNTQQFFSSPLHILTRNNNTPANKYLAVFFEEENCKECNNLHKNILTKKAIITMLNQMEVIQLNANNNEKLITPQGKKTTSNKWYEELNLTYKPAVVFFDKFGKEIIRKDALLKEFHFESIVDYVLTEAYKKQDNFQRYIEDRSDKIRASGQDVDIWK